MKTTEQIGSQQSQKVQKEAHKKVSIGVKKVDNTPFYLVINKNNVYITIGHDILKTCKDEEEARKAIKTHAWDLLLNAAAIYTNFVNKEVKKNETN